MGLAGVLWLVGEWLAGGEGSVRMGTEVLLKARLMKLDFYGEQEAAMATLLGPHTQRSRQLMKNGGHIGFIKPRELIPPALL